MHSILALAPLFVALQDWTAVPLPDPSIPRVRAEAELPAADGTHLVFGEWDAESGADERAEIPATMVVQWLQEEARRRGSQLAVSPNTPPLLLSGPAEDVAWARELLDGLDALGRRLEVPIDAWLVPAALPASTTVEQLAAREDARHWSGSLPSGDALTFGDPARRAFLADYEVEVATDSGVASPVIGYVETGERLYLSAARVDAGRGVQLFGVLDLAELDELQEFDTSTPDLGVTQQPLVDVVNVAFSGRASAGSLVRVAVEGSGVGDGAWTLFVRATTAADPSDAPRIGWRGLDLAMLATAPVELPRLDAGAGLGRRARLTEHVSDHQQYAPSAVLALLGRDRRRDLERPPVQWTDRMLLVHTADPARYDELRALVDGLEALHAPTTTCRVEHGDLSVELPVAAGMPARVLVGRERTLLVDYDVEIAPNTWMPSPRTQRTFDGLGWQAKLIGEELVGDCFVSGTTSIELVDRARASLGAVQLPDRRSAVGGGRVNDGSTSRWIAPRGTRHPVLVSRTSL